MEDSLEVQGGRMGELGDLGGMPGAECEFPVPLDLRLAAVLTSIVMMISSYSVRCALYHIMSWMSS